MEMLKQYSGFVVAGLFAVGLVSIFVLDWFGLSFNDESEMTSLWDGEANMRYIILIVTLAGIGLAGKSIMDKGEGIFLKAAGGVAALNLLLSIVYVQFIERGSDEFEAAESLGFDFAYGIGFFLMLLVMLAAAIIPFIPTNKK